MVCKLDLFVMFDFFAINLVVALNHMYWIGKSNLFHRSFVINLVLMHNDIL